MRIRPFLLAIVATALPAVGLAQGATPGAESPLIAEAAPQLKGTAALKGKRFYIAEYRVLFEVAGSATASTRAGYLPGRDFGGTRATVAYALAKPNLALFQAITDQAYADFLARLEAAGLKPEPADAFTRENGAVYEATVEGSKPGAELVEDVDLGHGKRKYVVMVPTGTRAVSRGFIGIGAGNIGKRIDFSKTNMEGVSVGMALNLAAQESSGTGSSLFKRESSANASAAMEVTMPPKTLGVLQTHARTELVGLAAPMPVPGQFGTLRESGGYDTQKDAAVQAINMIGRLALGVAGNNSKKVEMALEVDEPALQQQALKGLTAVNAGMAAALQ
ncbi:MAG: hypothetical protein EOO24_55475 [Comamonadaceae bacterium]|nr:MAG: hypothetical protein EOO24_55475 [Comamonadaceae bacterium]